MGESGHAEQEFHLCDYREALLSAFEARDCRTVRAVFGEICEKYVRRCPTLSGVHTVCFSVLHFLSATALSGGELQKSLPGEWVDPVESIRALSSAAQAEQWLLGVTGVLCAKLEDPAGGSGNALADSVTRYIRAHPDRPLSLQEVAQVFHRSPGHISSAFKKYRGVSFSQCVRAAKVARAKELLLEGRQVQEVSDALGYSDPYYFSKVFKKSEGLSPREFVLKNWR